jgi:flagellar biogenesis protein FliO
MTRRLKQLLPLIGLLAAASDGFAQSTNVLTLHSDLPSVGLSALRALSALAIVLAVFFGGLWLFRNGQRLVWRKTGAPKLTVLESRSLGNRLALYVVGYEQQRLLIGSSAAGLSLLSQLPDEKQAPVESPKPETNPSFGQQLQRILGQT